MKNTKGLKLGQGWNKGTKGVMKPNKTSFKKGERRSVSTEFKKGEMSERQKGENNSCWKGGVSLEKKYCLDCGIKLSRYMVKRCKKCFAKYQKGENHPNWLGGKSFESYTTDWTNTLKIFIKERDKYTCKICGKKQDNKTFCIHHIDYDKKNCNIDNLITLCRNCHTKTNIKREYWIKYFKNII